MAPAGAEMASYTISSPHSTVLEAFTRSLSPEENILMTHLVVWLLALISGVFLALRFLAIWYKKFALVVEDGLLAASWVRAQTERNSKREVYSVLVDNQIDHHPFLLHHSLNLTCPGHRNFVLRVCRHNFPLGSVTSRQCDAHRRPYRYCMDQIGFRMWATGAEPAATYKMGSAVSRHDNQPCSIGRNRGPVGAMSPNL